MVAIQLALTALALLAQDCHEPTAGFGAYGVARGPNGGTVYAMAVYDDGRGPALYLAGDFDIAGEIAVGSIVRFDGRSWEDLPGPGGAPVASSTGFGLRAMAVYDDGSGPALYVGGYFDASLGLPVNGIARWDGAAWSPVLTLSTQYSGLYGASDMVVWDDGSGPALYFAGTFNAVNGQPAASIAKYQGSSWSTVGNGYTGSFATTLAAYDDGSGEKLYVAGWNFPSLHNVQVWDGSSWSIQPTVFDSTIRSLRVHDDGSGAKLYAGGYFTSPGAGIARWDGASWMPVGNGLQFFPWSLTTFDDGGGSQLYAVGGSYVIPPPGWGIRAARWDGMNWQYLGLGLNSDAHASIVFDGGSGPALHVGGNFQEAGGKRADHVAKWDSAGWSRVYSSRGLIAPCGAMTVFDDGSGPTVYAEGGATYDFSLPYLLSDSLVRWNGNGWSQIVGVVSGVIETLAVHDLGGGPELYAGGVFDAFSGTAANSIVRWNGAGWSALGGGVTRSGGAPGVVNAIEIHDFGAGPRLVVGGDFDFAGGVSARSVAAWDGGAWSSIGSGFAGDVYDLEVFDDGGNGARLCAGGDFVFAGGTQVDYLAIWNGSAWLPLLGGMNRRVRVLKALDLGSGPRLAVGGEFYVAGAQIGGIIAERIALTDGSSWQALHQNGAGLSHDVDEIVLYDQGRGPELVVGGKFQTAGGKPIRNLARWDGVGWNAFDHQPDSWVESLQVFDDGAGTGPVLFAGGRFSSWGGTVSMCVARWAPTCPCPPAVYCTAKVNSQGCTPNMYSTGSTSLAENSLRLHAQQVINNKGGLLFWSTSPFAAPFQGGYLCAQPPVVRTPVQSSGGNPPPNDCSGSLHFHWSQAYVAAHGLALGEWYYVQYWSRDPADPATTSLSDAMRFLLCP